MSFLSVPLHLVADHNMLTLATLLLVSAVVINAVRMIYFHPLSKFPGPPFRSVTHLANVVQEVSGTFEQAILQLHERHGPVVRIGPDTLSFNTPTAWKDIYGSRPGMGQIPKDQMFYFSNRTHNETSNIINANDADHSRYRKLISHAFSESAIREQEPLMTPYFDLLIHRLKEGVDNGNDIVDMADWYTFTAFDIIGDLTYASSFDALSSGNSHFWMRALFTGMTRIGIARAAEFYPLLLLPLIKVSIRIAKGTWDVNAPRVQHRKYTALKTRERLASGSERKDFMSFILRHNNDGDERGMSEEEIISMAQVLLVAGTEPSATLLSGATYYITKNPRTLDKLKREVRDAFEDSESMTIDATARLPYLCAVLEESLRMYPPTAVRLPRRTTEQGAHINGLYIPPDTSVGVHQLSTYISPSLFHNPTKFAPERWLKNKPAEYKDDDLSAMQAFHVGPRNCVGRNLAYAEMRCILARMVWHFDMELCPESAGWRRQRVFFIFWEKGPLKIRLSHRKHGGSAK